MGRGTSQMSHARDEPCSGQPGVGGPHDVPVGCARGHAAGVAATVDFVPPCKAEEPKEQAAVMLTGRASACADHASRAAIERVLSMSRRERIALAFSLGERNRQLLELRNTERAGAR